MRTDGKRLCARTGAIPAGPRRRRRRRRRRAAAAAGAVAGYGDSAPSYAITVRHSNQCAGAAGFWRLFLRAGDSEGPESGLKYKAILAIAGLLVIVDE